jgi:clan AA aspartic protease
MRRVSRQRKSELDQEKQLMQKCYLANPLDHNLGGQVEFVVDTGASCIVIPLSLAKKLKLKTVGGGEGIMANGTKVGCEMVWVYINVDGEGLVAIAMVIKEAQPLLGLDVIKMLQLQIDPARERLLKPLKRFKLIRFLFKRGVIPSKTSSSKS